MLVVLTPQLLVGFISINQETQLQVVHLQLLMIMMSLGQFHGLLMMELMPFRLLADLNLLLAVRQAQMIHQVDLDSMLLLMVLMFQQKDLE